MPSCAVATCKNGSLKTKGSGVRYFRFPKNEDFAKQWLAACKRNDKVNLANACICSIHFAPECIEIPLRQRLLNYAPKNTRTLKPDALPTLYVPGVRPKQKDKDRLERQIVRDRKRIVELLLKENVEVVSVADVETPPTIETSSVKEELVMNTRDPFAVDSQVEKLIERIKVLELENDNLLKQVQMKNSTIDQYKCALSKVFTRGQIKKLLSTGRKRSIHWLPEDIAAAISLRSISQKAYRYLRAHSYPLPALSTLRTWVANFSIDTGILTHVLEVMKNKSLNLSENERLCVLSFDEISLCNRIDIEKRPEKKIGPHKSCQVVMAQGLIKNWEQPVYYQFDRPMDESILMDVISSLYDVGYTVVGIVGDMGNTKLWEALDISHTDCFFLHPVDRNFKIFVYADVSLMLKLARIDLIDQGFRLGNSSIDTNCFEELLKIPASELKIAHKLSQQHLVKGSLRETVRPATQLFSNSVAKAFEYCNENRLIPNDRKWKDVVYVVQLFNDWFDLCNSQRKYTDKCPSKNAFGSNLSVQKDLLSKMSKLMYSIKIGKHKSLVPFQKGILLTNNSLAQMYDYLREKYEVATILTYRLNKDVLEKFLDLIQGMEGTNEDPSPLDFKYRFRWLILGKYSEAVFMKNKNTVEDCESSLLDADKTEEDVCLPRDLLIDLSETQYEEETLTVNSFVELPYLEENVVDNETVDHLQNFDVPENMNEESLKVLAGYVAYRFKNKYDLGIPSVQLDITQVPSWLKFIPKGSLLHPNEMLFQATLKMEAEFVKMHGNSLSDECKLFTKLAERTIATLENNAIPLEVMITLSRTRTYIRLRNLNRLLNIDS